MPRYRRVTIEDRCQIQAYIEIGMSQAWIARQTGFNKSTVTREIFRNSWSGKYLAKRAEQMARRRFLRCRRKRLLKGSLQIFVNDLIAQGWSPDQISGRLRRERKLSICHETIYRYIRRNHIYRPFYESGLRRFRKKGMGRIRQRKLRQKHYLSIRERSSLIESRQRFGDWERDTMYAQRKKVLVCVERRSRFVKIARVQEPMSVHLIKQTKELLISTRAPVLSLTNDNGPEFMDADHFSIPVYYCDPRKPCQRGTVENTIGLIRQYIRRTADLDQITDQTIEGIENLLNHRPRKCLNYKTPYEVLFNKKVALLS